MPPRRFVLLDRDGTINAERHYLSDPGQLELLPGAAAGLAEMQRLGLGLVIVTNQSGIARGYFDSARLAEIHERLTDLLGSAGVRLDGIYICPHGPDDGCTCRKPLPGLVLQAARDLDFDPVPAFVIGDKPRDIELGRAVGATTLLVRTGYGAHYASDPGVSADHIVSDLVHAARVIGSHLVDGQRSRSTPA